MKRILSFILLLFAFPLMASELFPSLIGGRPAHKGEYPEIIYIRSGNSRCSASVIGQSVILTAAHCVKDEGEIGPVPSPAPESQDVEFVLDQIVYKAKCNQAPLYRDHKEDHDFALCKTDKTMSVKPAAISKIGPKIGDMVVLTGYGCVKPGGTGGNDGILRVGKAEVTKLPKGTDHWFYTMFEVAVCYGDSGGPSLLDTGNHLIIGVNSRGNIEDLSLMTALFTPESQKFLSDFAKAKKVDICGVTKKC